MGHPANQTGTAAFFDWLKSVRAHIRGAPKGHVLSRPWLYTEMSAGSCHRLPSQALPMVGRHGGYDQFPSLKGITKVQRHRQWMISMKIR